MMQMHHGLDPNNIIIELGFGPGSWTKCESTLNYYIFVVNYPFKFRASPQLYWPIRKSPNGQSILEYVLDESRKKKEWWRGRDRERESLFYQ